MFRLFIFVAAAVATAQGACLGGCYIPTTHYEEVGCAAIHGNRLSCCPIYYDCSEFFKQDPDKCYYQGEVYNHREVIPTERTEQHCAADCLCTKGELEEVTCANIECPDFALPPGDCFLAQDLEGCCSSKIVCPPFDDLATCEINGEVYYEGQRFPGPILPGRDWSDLSCVCQPNFEGKFEEPFCKKISCGTELRDSANFRNKCAPVYYGTRLDCPIHWECPQKGDRIVPNSENSQTNEKCYYGKKRLNIGDKLILDRSVNSPVINCECRIPPLVTCSQEPKLSKQRSKIIAPPPYKFLS